MGVGLLVTAAPVVGNTDPKERLSFDVEEGPNLNSFLREGPVAAHLLLRSGLDPRLLVAFPAGNSGVGLWFAHGSSPLTWTLRGRPQPLIDRDAKGRPLYGMKAEVSVTGVSDLIVKQAVLSSVRVLRDYQALGTFPAEVAAHPTTRGLDHHLGTRSPRRRGRLSPQHRGHRRDPACRSFHGCERRHQP